MHNAFVGLPYEGQEKASPSLFLHPNYKTGSSIVVNTLTVFHHIDRETKRTHAVIRMMELYKGHQRLKIA